MAEKIPHQLANGQPKDMTELIVEHVEAHHDIYYEETAIVVRSISRGSKRFRPNSPHPYIVLGDADFIDTMDSRIRCDTCHEEWSDREVRY